MLRKSIVLVVLALANSAMATSAPGGPGSLGYWQRPDKQGYASTFDRPIWFTIAEGVLSEIAYPRVDLVQTRDTFLVIKEDKKKIDERKLSHEVSREPGTLVFKVNSHSQEVKIEKNISVVNDSDAIIVDYTVEFPSEGFREIILIHNPIAAGTAGGDFIEVQPGGEKQASLLAYQGDVRGDESPYMFVKTQQLVSWSLPVTASSVGFESVNSPEDQLRADQWPLAFESAGSGNVAGALASIIQTRKVSFRVVVQMSDGHPDMDLQKKLFKTDFRQNLVAQKTKWHQYLSTLTLPMSDEKAEASVLVLKSLEDKTERGAFIAGPGNPELPWATYGKELNYELSRRRVGDSNFGYRRVWPRDLYHKAISFLALGDTTTALNVARWYKKTQLNEGWWSQNMHVDGGPSWRGYQQDETALPVVLVARLVEIGAANYSEFSEMVRKGINYMIQRGAGSQQERWEENAGMSPNSLSAAVQALRGAAWLENQFGDKELAKKYSFFGDSWTTNLKKWSLVPKGVFGTNYIPRMKTGEFGPWEGTQNGDIEIRNKRDKEKTWYKEDEILDLGFAQWIFAGLVDAKDKDFQNSLKLCDQNIYRESKLGLGKGYIRYSQDSYGEDHVGGLWPLLSGERALAALEAGENFDEHTKFIENSFTSGHMLAEQDTLSIRPLGWSHANFIILRKSILDKSSFYKYRKIGLKQK